MERNKKKKKARREKHENEGRRIFSTPLVGMRVREKKQRKQKNSHTLRLLYRSINVSIVADKYIYEKEKVVFKAAATIMRIITI